MGGLATGALVAVGKLFCEMGFEAGAVFYCKFNVGAGIGDGVEPTVRSAFRLILPFE